MCLTSFDGFNVLLGRMASMVLPPYKWWEVLWAPSAEHHMSPHENSWQSPGRARWEPFSDTLASRGQSRRNTKENGAEFMAHGEPIIDLERTSSLQN